MVEMEAKSLFIQKDDVGGDYAIIYNTLNKELLLSPRIGFSWKPRGAKKDIVYRGALGIYDQPPFFREMLRGDGTLNKELKAQRSWQVVAGLDHNFKLGDRPFRFTTEAYYKSMTRVDPYDINNVHIQYFGNNGAKAYATGITTRRGRAGTPSYASDTG